ncbi:MAG TPA: toll/interleukin-1 receptor domain-containing protein, partial [Isosphaeraceae bacterium]
MMARDDGWDVYVIHNPKDTPRVRQLVTQWRELGLRVFFREDSIPLGADAGRARETALKGSRRVVFMISPAALTEELANQETGIALFLDPAANQRLLLPVIIEPTLEDSIPLTIRRLYPADLTDPVQRRDEYHRLLRTLLGDDRRDLPDLPDPLEGDGAGGVKPPPYVLPRRPACFGRDAEVGALVGTLLEDSPPPTPILGGPGMGKTTVTLAALYDPRVVERFGSRRFFVRCDSARTGADVVAFVGNALGVPIGPHREPLVIAELARAPAVLVLDNLETPWEADGAGTEAVLDGLAAVPGLVLVASIRGAERPAGGWRERITIERLELPAARDAFLAVAGREKFAADPLLDDLLVTVADRVPLAVVLLAHFSEPQPNLTPVWNEWQARGPDILQRLKGDHRLLSIAFSVEVSISSPRMNDPAR